MTAPAGVVDLHVHSAPSLAPRHYDDPGTVATLTTSGVDQFVLKAHEGSTAERALLAGPGVIGGIVLNGPVGGANPDAVEVAARFGARMVWLPTVSSPAHRRAERSPELAVHAGISFAEVPVCHPDGDLLTTWYDVFDVVAQYDLVLASGHVPVPEAIKAFQVAHARGVRRFLVNHPLLPFLGWQIEHAAPLSALDARIEIGCVADALGPPGETATSTLADAYPAELFVFGSDLGHTEFPKYADGLAAWVAAAGPVFSDAAFERIMTVNGAELVQP